MFTIMMLAPAQAAAPVPPTPEAGQPGKTIIREIVVRREGDPKGAADSKRKEERSEIVIIRDGGDEKASLTNDRRVRIVDVGPGAAGQRREVRIVRPGTEGSQVIMPSCDNGAQVESEAIDKDGKKTRVMICAQGGNSNLSRVQQLRDAAKRIETDPNLSEETRTRIAVAINEAIAKLPVSE